MAQLPQIPDFNIDIDIPVVQLPDLPDLPPPPQIPELSHSIAVVLDIFKIVTAIQCLYRKVPLSPEWYVGTKIAHKTERQGYLSADFLDSRMPYPTQEWLEAIRVSSHVNLNYNVDFVIDVLREALQPLAQFPTNLIQGGVPNAVQFDINPRTGVNVQTSSLVPENSISRLPELI
jgi:hypothetical protein